MKKRKNDNPIGLPEKYMSGYEITDFEKVFEEVYQKGIWSHADGSGSDSRPEFVPDFFKHFSEILSEYNIKDVGDLGCGSHYIFKDYDWPEDITYTGYDASKTALERARKNCNRSDFKFQHLSDFNKIPPHELLITKDVLCHWPNDLVKEFLRVVIPRMRYTIIVGATHINLTTEIEQNSNRVWLFKTKKEHDYGIWLFEGKRE